MPNRVLLEEIHLSATVPESMRDAERELVRRQLNRRAFRFALRKAVLRCLQEYPVLGRVRLTLAV